ncbi:MAG: hypothetical protein F6K35_50045 [Okeania sp. SIO2H7]|nr:hypothetical protein [Okeania sp. SIO2H7]
MPSHPTKPSARLRRFIELRKSTFRDCQKPSFFNEPLANSTTHPLHPLQNPLPSNNPSVAIASLNLLSIINLLR